MVRMSTPAEQPTSASAHPSLQGTGERQAAVLSAEIIAAAGLDPDELARTVAEWRERSFHMETILADHFDVEELAATIEVLAAEIARVHVLAGGGESPLARAILADSTPLATPPAAPDEWTTSLIFGYPALRHLARASIDFDSRRMIRQDIIMHATTGTWTALNDGESITGACARFSRELEASGL